MANIANERLNDRQEKFCQLYATEEEFFGNGVAAYLEVYDIDKTKPNWYKTACAAAAQSLGNIKVINRISELLTTEGFNDANVDKQLNFLIGQFSDFKSKLGAIREYNNLKQRITEKREVFFKNMNDEELAKEVAEEVSDLL